MPSNPDPATNIALPSNEGPTLRQCRQRCQFWRTMENIRPGLSIDRKNNGESLPFETGEHLLQTLYSKLEAEL